MLKVFAMEWSKSGYFKEKIMKILTRAFNKDPPEILRRIVVKEFLLEPIGPEIRSV